MSSTSPQTGPYVRHYEDTVPRPILVDCRKLTREVNYVVERLMDRLKSVVVCLHGHPLMIPHIGRGWCSEGAGDVPFTVAKLVELAAKVGNTRVNLVVSDDFEVPTSSLLAFHNLSRRELTVWAPSELVEPISYNIWVTNLVDMKSFEDVP